jgi:ribosome-associated protein
MTDHAKRVPDVDPPPENRSGLLKVSRSVSIPLDELFWRFSASGGPGGQHANTSNTRAEVRFDIAGSPSLNDVQRERLLARLGNEVRVAASDERSQARNRSLALERLRDRLAENLRVEAPRRPTKPSKGARTRRMEAKSQRGELKKGRSRRYGPDE